MKLKRKRKNLFIPLFSMSDVAFLLLIFIMLISLINYRVTVNIDYAQAQMALRTTADKNLEIWIDSIGGIYIDGIASNKQVLEQRIIELYLTAPDTRVHIIADRNSAFENINNVLEVLQSLEYRTVSFVVRAYE
ncbi:MAG: biopolymer transporter ExbD [Treponema sp.]|nr:biopolymer transporter ExbD [Treponema sp.]